jgi:transcriptional regulator with XRE-family HTH domain
MFMANNLEARIKISGMTKKEVAAANGVTPETISRQIHSKVQMTVSDAEKYAAILNCSVQQILFRTEPIPVVARGNISANGECTRTPCVIDGKCSPCGYVYAHEYYNTDNVALYWTVDKNTQAAEKRLWDKSIVCMLRDPIENQYVHRKCIQNHCIVKVTGENNLLSGELYPEPGALYTLDQPYEKEISRGLKLEWATPIVAVTFRPELRGMHIKWN